MKSTPAIVYISLIFILFSCENENGSQNLPELSVNLVHHSPCKGSKSTYQIADIPSSQSCLEYSYDAANKVLRLKHINAGFNCCPDSLYCHVAFNQDTIIISEFEESALCNCDCLFDLEFEVSGVEMQPCQLKLIEPYASDQDKIVFGINLIIDQEGTFCVFRTQYPWNI